MKHFLISQIFFLLTLIAITSCKPSIVPQQNKEKLPLTSSCEETFTITKNNYVKNINKLKQKDLKNLSYSTTYTMFHSATDSLEKNILRFNIAENSKRLVNKSFKDIVLLDDNILLNSTYNKIMFNTSPIKRNTSLNNIKNLTVKNDKRNQVFIELHVYARENTFKNYITFFVFNPTERDLLYMDSYKFNCDIRDTKLLEKIINHGFLALKNSSKSH